VMRVMRNERRDRQERSYTAGPGWATRERENLRWAATVLESTVFLNFGVGRGSPGPPLGSAHGDMSPN
jgi:hypothetical protein